MQPQQQTVVTSTRPVVQPMYISQPYHTASVVNSYAHRQSMIIGILLIVGGCLSIIFNIVDLAFGIDYNWFYYSYNYYIYDNNLSVYSNGVVGHGFWCGVLVSILYVYCTRNLSVCLLVCLSICDIGPVSK